MIRSFKDRNTRRFFEGGRVRAFQGFADQAVRRLTVLDSADALEDLAGLPSNRLEALRGDGAGRHGIRINAQWRICFAGPTMGRTTSRSSTITRGKGEGGGPQERHASGAPG